MRCSAILIVSMALLATPALAGGMKASRPSAAGQEPQTWDHEPGRDVRLKRFQVIYVDDHTCPAGQIRKFTAGSKQLGVRATRECVGRSDHDLRFGLSLQLPLSAADPPDADIVDRFARLARHVSRAMLFAQRLNRHEPQASVLTGLLSALTCGAACLDGTGRVLLANPALLSLAGDGLDVVRGRLVTSRPADQAPFDALLRRAGSTPASLGPDVVPLQRPSGRRPLLAGALPLSAERQESLFGGELPGCRVLVTVTDPEAQVPARPEAALRALALSGAEARVAALVGQGLSPRDVAERLALTEETVRTTLKQVFGKLGVSRQGELVGLVTQLSLLNGPS